MISGHHSYNTWSTLCAAVALTAPGCSGLDETSDSTSSMEAPSTSLGSTAAVQGVKEYNPEGDDNVDSGYTKMESAAGEISIPYRVAEGRAIYGGDVDLGPVSANGEILKPRGANPPGTAWKWPNGDVPYVFDVNATDEDKQDILQGLQYLSQNTAIKFHPRGPGETDYLKLIPGSLAISEGIGRKGGEQYVYVPTFDLDAVAHEIGHALGLYHEHQRKDRDEHVTHHPECVENGKAKDFKVHQGTVDLEPYDYGSVMHYDAFFSSCDDCWDWCPTLASLDDNGPIELIPLPEGQHLSVHDKNSLIRMYPFVGSADEKGDRHGASLATGDFDNDGYDDVVAGAPGENLNSLVDTGLVRVYKGVHSAVLRSRTEIWPPSAVGGERFGEALAVGDFNGDGYDDLAVGAPGRDVDGHVDWGSIHIAYGSAKHLAGVSTTLTPAILQFPAECPKEFGRIVNVGDFDRDQIDDLLLGCMGSRAFILLGQPDKKFKYSKTLKLESYYPNADLARSSLRSIAVSPAYYPNSSSDILRVALGYEVKDKNETMKRGVVFRFDLSDHGDFYSINYHDTLKSPFFDDGFGAALRFLNKGELAVGIPKADVVRDGKVYVDAGEVRLYKRSEWSKYAIWKQTYRSDDFAVKSYSGDQFGSAMASFPDFNNGGGDWLAIGSPFEDTLFSISCDPGPVDCGDDQGCGGGCGGGFSFSNAGSTYLFQPNATTSKPMWKFHLMQAVTQTEDSTLYNNTELLTLISATKDPAGTALSPMADEYFGSAMTVRYGPEGRAHLVVGAPGNANNHGGRLVEYDMDMKFGYQTSYINAYRYRQRTAWLPRE